MELYQLKGEGRSIRGIARELGVSRNSVRKYLRSPGKARRRWASKLDPYAEYIDGRLSEGLDDCVVLLRELRVRGYSGGQYGRRPPYRLRELPRRKTSIADGCGRLVKVCWVILVRQESSATVREVWQDGCA